MVTRLAFLAAASVLSLAACGAAQTPAASESRASPDGERGALLYDTACSQCHTTQPHWREKRLVRSWSELVFQVDRWQKVAGQNWREADIRDVASFLNDRFYHLSCPAAGC